MAQMGKYCKAYPVERLRQFNGWTEKRGKTEKQEVDGKEVEATRDFNDDDYLFLQENLVVTDGIFMDELIIFDDITPEWTEFCTNQLEFSVPTYEPVRQQEETSAGQ